MYTLNLNNLSAVENVQVSYHTIRRINIIIYYQLNFLNFQRETDIVPLYDVVFSPLSLPHLSIDVYVQTILLCIYMLLD